ncbi:MAG: 4-(cytidine 5'-diphospho)-2-C-methyl-D-erythritol kinase [Candidatus Omnitrophota bacterium]
MAKLILNSYAKLNLYLAVLNKRRDNYHNIKTLFERISLADRLILSPREDAKIKVSCRHPGVPKDSSNLCYQGAELLRKSFNIKKGLQIRLIKRIPVGAGLGGGSSNAATLLWGLNRFWRLNLSRKKLLVLAAKLGSDVPFFIHNTSFAIGSGRGEKIKPLGPGRLPKLWHVIVVPDFEVSTPLIYGKWDQFRRRKTCCKSCSSGLTIPEFDVKILTSVLSKDTLGLAGGILFNGLEEAAFRAYPEIKRVKDSLVSLGINSVLMSGSGPAVFGIVSSRKEALALRGKIRGIEKSWRVFTASTL